jgi:hypothetical protein
MDKKKFEIIILMLLMAFGINYLTYTYFIKPQYDEAAAARDSYKKLENRIGDMKKKQKELPDLEKQVKEMASGKDGTRIFPASADNQTIIREFYYACRQYGINGDTLTFSSEDMGLAGSISSGEKGSTNASGTLNGIKPNYITITFSGKMDKVESFIDNITKVSSRNLLLSSVEITGTASDGINIARTQGSSNQDVTVRLVLVEFLYNPGTAQP